MIVVTCFPTQHHKGNENPVSTEKKNLDWRSLGMYSNLKVESWTHISTNLHSISPRPQPNFLSWTPRSVYSGYQENTARLQTKQDKQDNSVHCLHKMPDWKNSLPIGKKVWCSAQCYRWCSSRYPWGTKVWKTPARCLCTEELSSRNGEREYNHSILIWTSWETRGRDGNGGKINTKAPTETIKHWHQSLCWSSVDKYQVHQLCGPVGIEGSSVKGARERLASAPSRLFRNLPGTLTQRTIPPPSPVKPLSCLAGKCVITAREPVSNPWPDCLRRHIFLNTRNV